MRLFPFFIVYAYFTIFCHKVLISFKKKARKNYQLTRNQQSILLIITAMALWKLLHLVTLSPLLSLVPMNQKTAKQT